MNNQEIIVWSSCPLNMVIIAMSTLSIVFIFIMKNSYIPYKPWISFKNWIFVANAFYLDDTKCKLGHSTKKSSWLSSEFICHRSKPLLTRLFTSFLTLQVPWVSRSSFQRKYLDLWRPTVEILSRMCQSYSL